MAVEHEIITTQVGPVTVQHPFSRQIAGSNKLLLILPGRAYTNEMPGLYYLREAAEQRGWNVISASFALQTAPGIETGVTMIEESQLVLSAVDLRHYIEVCIAGKSMGSPIASALIHGLDVPRKRLILLTPVGGAVESAGDVRTLAVVGTADPAYDPDAVAADAARPHITWQVLEGVDHGLLVPGDWLGSLAMLTKITGASAAFLEVEE